MPYIQAIWGPAAQKEPTTGLAQSDSPLEARGARRSATTAAPAEREAIKRTINKFGLPHNGEGIERRTIHDFLPSK